ncbi:MAG: thermonuclease family protein [Kiritimatiellia bacterium]
MALYNWIQRAGLGLAALWLGWAGAPAAQAAKPWQTLADCRMVESGTNDGDSFRVQWNGGEWTVRLYFADTPESDWRFRDRTRAQAAYFGITDEQAVAVGQRAKAFTRKFLRNGFEVRTRWQGVFGNARATRKYGIVTAGGQDLAEALVANGLARIHGMGIGGQTWEEVERLRALETRAKSAGKGAWGDAAERTAKN